MRVKSLSNWHYKEFEYVWDGETKLATNCESCRYKNRIRYMNPNKKRKK